MKVKRLSDEVLEIENFLSKEECNHWIEFSEKKGYEVAKINMGFRSQVVNTGIRNNERVIYNSLDLANQLWEKIKIFVVSETKYAKACGLNERFRFYKYSPGQEFKRHRDGAYIRNTNERSEYTLIIYLNEEMIGGETEFTKLKIQPKTETAIIFKHERVHSGNIITKGLKYVLRTDIMYKSKKNEI